MEISYPLITRAVIDTVAANADEGTAQYMKKNELFSLCDALCVDNYYDHTFHWWLYPRERTAGEPDKSRYQARWVYQFTGTVIQLLQSSPSGLVNGTYDSRL